MAIRANEEIINLRLPSDEKKALQARARASGISMSAVVRDALRLYLQFPQEFRTVDLSRLTYDLREPAQIKSHIQIQEENRITTQNLAKRRAAHIAVEKEREADAAQA